MNWLHTLEDLEDLLLNAEATKRLSIKDLNIYSDADVRGSLAKETPILDEHDGWHDPEGPRTADPGGRF